MTTPNEELILKLRGQAYTTCRPDQLCDQSADLLQSQAERIAGLDSLAANAIVAAADSQKAYMKLLDEDFALRAELADMAVNTATYEHLVGLANDTATRLLKERDTLRAQLADAELHTKQVERGLDKATAQLAEIEKTEPVDVVLTFNYGQLVKVHIADHTLYEVDLSPKPYFQVCWAHGWAGIYSSEDEAAEDCLSLCGHGRSIREIKPGDDGYRNPNAINLIEQRFPVSQPLTHPMPAESKDAERYRWLRDYLISPSTNFDDLIVSADKADTLDGVIDAARAKGAK